MHPYRSLAVFLNLDTIWCKAFGGEISGRRPTGAPCLLYFDSKAPCHYAAGIREALKE